MIVLLQSLLEKFSESGRPKEKTATIPGCEEDVSSKILKKL